MLSGFLPQRGFVQQAHAADGKKRRSFVAILFATADTRRYILKTTGYQLVAIT